jgi:hypothetical protein
MQLVQLLGLCWVGGSCRRRSRPVLTVGDLQLAPRLRSPSDARRPGHALERQQQDKHTHGACRRGAHGNYVEVTRSELPSSGSAGRSRQMPSPLIACTSCWGAGVKPDVALAAAAIARLFTFAWKRASSTLLLYLYEVGGR